MTKTIQEMAQELGIKKENLEAGLKKDERLFTKSINDAYKYKLEGEKRQLEMKKKVK